MDIFSIILTIAGLALFETASSVDNAIINAQVLGTLKEKTRRWFLTWGLITSVFVVRGFLPFIIIFLTNPSVGVWGALTASFSSDPAAREAIEHSAPILLIGGGTFLLFLFFNWLLMEPKNISFRAEKAILNLNVWFYAIVSILLCTIVWFALLKDPLMAFSAVVGSSAFFIIHGFSKTAAEAEKQLFGSRLSDVSKLLYLEVIDATFSIDGVLGAFAFTLSIPLILLGNGIGAIVVRQLTVGHINQIQKYLYLKNGAMYSIFFLGSIMVLESFGISFPEWLTPVVTVAVISFFFFKSKRALSGLSSN